MKNLTLIGRLEKINFLDLDLQEIDSKIDTGAYSSAIHCHDIRENVEEHYIAFKLLDPNHPDYCKKEVRFTEYTKTRVKSAIGYSESRYKIKTSIRIGLKTYITGFTLSDRSDMKFPVLLGRKLLNKRFIVDVSQTYILPIVTK